MIALTLAMLMAAAGECGWHGIRVAEPEPVVDGDSVRLREPLRVLEVAPGSPARVAGIDPGARLVEVGGAAWDAGGFLPAVVRLHTVAPGERLRMRVADEGGERRVDLMAVACNDEQAEERRHLLARLGRMEGAFRARDAAERKALQTHLEAEERAALEQAMADADAAIREVEERLQDPEIRRRMEKALQAAQAERTRSEFDYQRAAREYEAQARRAAGLDEEELHRVQQEVLKETQAARERVEESSRREMEDHLRALAEEMERRAQDPELRERLEAAAREMEELSRGMAGMAEEPELHRRLEESARQAAEAARRLQDEAFSDTYRQLREELEQERALLQDPEAFARAQEDLQRALEEVRQDSARMRDARRLQAEQLQEEVRRMLAQSERGGEARRDALLEASRAYERSRRASGALAGASFVPVGPALASYVGVDHGLFVEAVEPGTPLAQAGVRAGDVIVSVGGHWVGDLEEAFEALNRSAATDATTAVSLELHSAAGRRTVTLQVEPSGSHPGPI